MTPIDQAKGVLIRIIVLLHTRYGGFRVYRGRQNSPWTFFSHEIRNFGGIFFFKFTNTSIRRPLIIGRHEQLTLISNYSVVPQSCEASFLLALRAHKRPNNPV